MRKFILIALALALPVMALVMPARAQACHYGTASLRLAVSSAYDCAPAVIEEVRVQRVRRIREVQRIQEVRVQQVREVRVEKVKIKRIRR